MRLVQVNFAFDREVTDPVALLDRYHTLTGWSDALTAAGVSVAVVQRFSRDGLLQRNHVDYVLRAEGRLPWRDQRLHAAVLAWRPDVVHVNGFDRPMRVWQLRRALPSSVAMVVQDHSGRPPKPWIPTGVARRVLMRAPDGYLFTASGQADPWTAGGYVAASDVHEVLSASTEFRPLDRAEAQRRTGVDGAPSVLWVARLDANKDPLTVLAAFSRALATLPGATLTMIYRDAPLLAAVRQYLDVTPVTAARVRLVGPVPHDELRAWYSAADIFVQGSGAEVCGYSLVEACACGAVPIVSDIPSFRAITGGGAVGRLWPRGDVAACAAALIAVGAQDLPAARQAVLGHFDRHLSWASVGRRARGVYERVVARRRGHGRR